MGQTIDITRVECNMWTLRIVPDYHKPADLFVSETNLRPGNPNQIDKINGLYFTTHELATLALEWRTANDKRRLELEDKFYALL